MVCQVCWTTTETFHELYRKSKEVQEKFLNSLVKIEPHPIDVVLITSSEECNPIAEENRSIKVEQNAGKVD